MTVNLVLDPALTLFVNISVKDCILTVQEDISTVKEDISTVKEGVSAVKECVSAVKEGISAVKEGISAVKEGISAVKEGISAVKEGVSAVKERVSAVKEGISAVKEGMSSQLNIPSPVVEFTLLHSSLSQNVSVTLDIYPISTTFYYIFECLTSDIGQNTLDMSEDFGVLGLYCLPHT